MGFLEIVINLKKKQQFNGGLVMRYWSILIIWCLWCMTHAVREIVVCTGSLSPVLTHKEYYTLLGTMASYIGKGEWKNKCILIISA